MFPVAIPAAAGIALWVRYLRRRQAHWREELAQRIPVHSKFWREERAAEGELLYVAIGDSAAQGIGASRPAHSYVGFIAAALREHTDRPLRVVNLAVSGATVGLAIETQLPALAKLEPDILTVSIGANDMAAFDPARLERQYRELLDALPSHAIVADLPTFYFLPGERKVRVANAIVRRLAAERGLTVAPLHAGTRRYGLWGVSTQFAGDLFHPNDRGYRVWAAAFIPAAISRLHTVDSGGNAAHH
jgi:lysophospholipase L1-like esterase